MKGDDEGSGGEKIDIKETDILLTMKGFISSEGVVEMPGAITDEYELRPCNIFFKTVAERHARIYHTCDYVSDLHGPSLQLFSEEEEGQKMQAFIRELAQNVADDVWNDFDDEKGTMIPHRFVVMSMATTHGGKQPVRVLNKPEIITICGMEVSDCIKRLSSDYESEDKEQGWKLYAMQKQFSKKKSIDIRPNDVLIQHVGEEEGAGVYKVVIGEYVQYRDHFGSEEYLDFLTNITIDIPENATKIIDGEEVEDLDTIVAGRSYYMTEVLMERKFRFILLEENLDQQGMMRPVAVYETSAQIYEITKKQILDALDASKKNKNNNKQLEIHSVTNHGKMSSEKESSSLLPSLLVENDASAISLLSEGAVRHLIDVKRSQQNKNYVQPVVVQIIGFEFNPVLTQPVCWNVIISDGCNAVKATFDPNSSKLNALVSRGPVLYKLIRISEFSTWKDRIYILNADAVWVQRKYNQTMIGNPIEVGIVSTNDADERKSINEYSKAMPDYNETYPVSTTTNTVLTFQVSDFEHLEVKLKGDKKNAASFDGGHLSKTMTDTSSGVKFKLLIYPRGDTLYMSQHGWASFHLICMDTFPTKPSICRIWNKTIRIVGRIHLGGGKSTPIESAFRKVGDHWKISKLIQHVDVATTCLNELGDWIINVDLEITVDGTSWSPHFLNT